MAELTPERAERSLDRAVDIAQFFGLVAAFVIVLSGVGLFADAVGDDAGSGAAGLVVIAAGVVVGAVAWLLACWARAWMLRGAQPS